MIIRSSPKVSGRVCKWCFLSGEWSALVCKDKPVCDHHKQQGTWVCSCREGRNSTDMEAGIWAVLGAGGGGQGACGQRRPLRVIAAVVLLLGDDR